MSRQVNEQPFKLICGPCQLESRDHIFKLTEEILTITTDLKIDWILKTSFDKANRTSGSSKRGVGINNGTHIFYQLKQEFPDVKILTDVHETTQVKEVSPFVDALQIPAFLSRQTDLITAACLTDKIVNIKKGQFMSPSDIRHVIHKCKQVRHIRRVNAEIMITERGTSFGYNNLVVDMTGLQTMKEIIKEEGDHIRLVIDGTHAVQKPGALDGKSGGNRSFVPNLIKAALTYGLGGVFMEVHDDPDNAPSDGPNAVHLKDLPRILQELQELDNFIKYNYE
tara:strand:+ start:346 stop:1188 length:843 start_codon:yes stop_codon:yes gene_type:complete